jgi:hypothetical protein
MPLLTSTDICSDYESRGNNLGYMRVREFARLVATVCPIVAGTAESASAFWLYQKSESAFDDEAMQRPASRLAQ